MTGKELLDKAASMDPHEGVKLIRDTFKDPANKPLVDDYMDAIKVYYDENGLKDDAPDGIKALSEAAQADIASKATAGAADQSSGD